MRRTDWPLPRDATRHNLWHPSRSTRVLHVALARSALAALFVRACAAPMPGPTNDPVAAKQGASKLAPIFHRISAEEEAAALEAACVHGSQMAQYGYHDTNLHPLPKHLVRYIEPTEGEYDQRVEYDMDEQGTPTYH